MSIKVAINGFGRIGRTVLRAIVQRYSDVQVVAINDIADPKVLIQLLKRDSVFGEFPRPLKFEGNKLYIEGLEPIEFLSEKELTALPWKSLGLDFVIESTGVFRKRAQIEKHLEAGAPKVLLTVPAKDEIDATIVLGVNDGDLKPEHKIISNASCTTNCLAPMVKVLLDNFGVEQALMTTVHAYTNDQRIVDAPHKDLRRARAGAFNIIPTTTGAAKATGKVLPQLAGKIDGMAMRVPVVDGSIVDLVSVLSKEVTAEEVNAAMKKAAENELKGILQYTEEPLVSSDIIGNPHSSIFDALSTQVIGGKGTMVKTVSWYDNEYGYSCRVVELIKKAASLK